MKKKIFFTVLLIAFSFLVLSGCEEDEVVHLGLNAQIMEMDAENQTVCVKDVDESGVFGEKCYIDCSEAVEKHQIYYCNYKTHDLQELEFKDLQIGDEIVLALSETEFTKITEDAVVETSQIQLGTQRLN